MKANHVLAAVAVALCFTACSKNDGPETLIPAERKSVENLDVTNYGDTCCAVHASSSEYKRGSDTCASSSVSGSREPNTEKVCNTSSWPSV